MVAEKKKKPRIFESTKTKKMRGNSYLETKLLHWKDKAKSRRKELEKKSRRIKELEKSRANWKAKAQGYKNSYEELKARGQGERLSSSKKPRGHSYTSELIQICLSLRIVGNCSLRSCIKVLKIIGLYLEIELKSPSPSSIRNWELKLGYDQIQKVSPSSEQWVIIVDESVLVGRQRMVLVVGIAMSQYAFKKALSFEEVQILSLGLQSSWKGQDIARLLESLPRRGYEISYVVSDGANNLVKAMDICKIPRVEDCTHAFGKLIEKYYKEHEQFEAFSKTTGQFRRQVGLSQHAEFMPPRQRSKGRFLNLTQLSRWAKNVLQIAEQYQANGSNKQTFEKISWILDYKDLVEQMAHHLQLLNDLFAILKQQGLSYKTAKKCRQLLQNSQAPLCFKKGVKAYLKRNLGLLANSTKIICCSDVIESIFGRFKNRLSSNPEIGFTDSCLAIANFGQELNPLEVQQAMENVKMKDLIKWRENNLPLSLQQRKKRLFKNLT